MGGRRETLLAGWTPRFKMAAWSFYIFSGRSTDVRLIFKIAASGRMRFANLRDCRGSRHPVVIASTLFVKFVVNDVSERVAGPFNTVPDMLY